MPWFQDSSLQASLEAVLADSALLGAVVGACVTDSSGKRLFEHNADLRFVPASNQKILTALFAVETLGPDYRPVTRLWKEKGRVVVAASGDPTLSLKDLRGARKALKLFDGLPVAVQAPFQPSLGPGWEWDDLPWYYAGTTTALTCDDARFSVFASHGRLEPIPPELRVKIVRQASTAKLDVTYDPATNTLFVKGPLPKERQKLGEFAQGDPTQVAAHALGGPLQSQPQDLPARQPDLTLTGKPISEDVKQCLESSDNMITERLLAMAAIQAGPFAKGIYPDAPDRMLAFWTAKTGLTQKDMRPVDGCGLSRHNQVTPQALCTILCWALRRPYSSLWLQSLPAGGEGTLRNRLKDSTFIGKTGTMDAVVSLSGYLTSGGKRYVMSLLINNSIVPASEVRAVQDRFVRTLEQGLAGHVEHASNQ